jgi:2-polyprenyl-6-hydroxyphenyl methylase/3-demethylubiquinone-9 3-methyltransferase
MRPRNKVCLRFHEDAGQAANCYAATFPDGTVTAVHDAPGDRPSGERATS